MSEKSSSKPSAAKSGPKLRPGVDPDEVFDFLGKPQGKDELGRLAHYRVLKVLGKGGMGIVFMAEDTRLHRVVAIKVMLPSIAKKEIARDRFIREARATAAIEHDHIVTIYEVSKEDVAVPYLAMQFLKGVTLDDYLKAGKTLNIPQIMRIGKEIAKGLAAAHDRKLIHRDIKPSNIWLDAANKGRVKILDFGLARPTNEETHITQEGMILGSPAYMSPEQARGENVDERIDLFSLGCVLYRLIAGRLPFAGKDAMSMLLAITSKEPAPLQQLNSDVPPALAELVHRLLAKKPGDRPASAKDVVQAIQDIERDWVATGRTVASRPVKTGGKDATVSDKRYDVEPVLEESAITELELQGASDHGAAPKPRGGCSWVLAAMLGVVLGVMSIVCFVVVVVVNDVGFVEVTFADDTARKMFGDRVLTVRDHHDLPHELNFGESQRFPSGGYKIDDSALPKGIQIAPKEFSLKQGESLTIIVSYKSDRPELVLIDGENAKKAQRDWATYLKCKIVEDDTRAGKLVLIPPGEFQMGTTEEQMRQHVAHLAEAGKFDKKQLPGNYQNRLGAEKPQHKVRISKPFYIGMNEVSYGQFSKFVMQNKHLTEPETSGVGGQGLEAGKDPVRRPEFNWMSTGFKQTTEHPVCNITWKDADAYCDWLSKKENKVYRLPTEAEWEYACRAGTTTLWSFGDDVGINSDARAHMWFAPVKFGKLPISVTSHPVGGKKANPFGLHDMHGNIAEMCADGWDAKYYERGAKDPFTIDPRASDAAGPKTQRVVRGGSFLDAAQIGRSAFRSSADPTLGHVTIGFRVVCEVPLPAE